MTGGRGSASHARRAGFLDLWRGLSVVLMVLMHTMFQCEEVWNLRMWVLHWWLYPWLHLLFAGSFIFIAGLCTRLTRSNLRRGVQVLQWAALVTAVSLLMPTGIPIYFGVLHCLGTMMVLFGLIERTPLERAVRPALFVVWAGLFVVAWQWYQTAPNGGWLTLVLGMPPPIIMGDYYPLIPYLPLFLAGAAIGPLVAQGRGPNWLYEARLPVLNAVGRNALLVYLLHLPIVFILLLILFGWPPM
ncbi:MAG TPA: heparan-alpha-glucosaminide N-acetyltransferase domain-containing protein [Terriglobales bacterium]|nr:heparan-alpha-glucosaminide N-acetyltransferase domain-containing protein [Terriglobales bacterium]